MTTETAKKVKEAVEECRHGVRAHWVHTDDGDFWCTLWGVTDAILAPGVHLTLDEIHSGVDLV